MIYALCSIIALLAILLVACFIWSFTDWRPGFLVEFCHNKLGWHEPDENEPLMFDGCSMRSKCKWCGKEILQDSQGNWF